MGNDDKPAPQPLGYAPPAEIVPFFTESPLLEKRRVAFEAADLVNLLSEGLARRGVPKEKLARSRWVWVSTPEGAPRLYVIFPGPEA